MHKTDSDIIIIGAGIAGLSGAAGFGAAGFSVICIEPEPPAIRADDVRADFRTTAFLQGAKQFLERAGVWDKLTPFATPLQVMRIADAGQMPPVIRDFNASEISDAPFGWNFPNRILRRELLARIEELPHVRLHTGLRFQSCLSRDHHVIVTLDDGTRLRSKLLIGADGRDSDVRKSVGIDVKTRRYGQKAMVFAVTHEQPHDCISTEVHRAGGPFTLVPLPDHNNKPCSAVVWMETGASVRAITGLDDADFNAAATERSAGVYGPLTRISAIQTWPIISQIADKMTAARVALVAEAAHVVPPIGAQGLNMSLADMACLLDLTNRQPDPGTADILTRYHRRRYPEITLRVKGVDALNRTSMTGHTALQTLRRAGITALHGVPAVRKGMMHLGLGAR